MPQERNSREAGKIDATFRNGSITAIGIISGFSLSFVTRWAANPVPWQVVDIVAVIPLLIGILLQMKAMAELLNPNSLQIENYVRAKQPWALQRPSCSMFLVPARPTYCDNHPMVRRPSSALSRLSSRC